MSLHDEEQIDDPPRPPAFGGKSRDELLVEEIIKADQRRQEREALEREQKVPRLITWPLIFIGGVVALVTLWALSIIGDHIQAGVRATFDDSPMELYLTLVAIILAIIAVRYFKYFRD